MTVVKRDLKVNGDPWGVRVPLETEAIQVLRVVVVWLELMGVLAIRDIKEYWEQRVKRVNQVHRVLQDRLDLPVHMDLTRTERSK